MSADREADQDMTHRDIALLLADAADGVEVGIAPTQAVVRGGRRRRARRWAVAAAAALAIVGTTGTVALAGLPGGGGRVEPSAPRPSATPDTLRYQPHRTELASGTEDGKDWEVYVDVWDAPRDKAQAEAQLTAMGEYKGEWPASVRTAADLVGKSTFFVQRGYEGDTSVVIENSVPEGDANVSTDMESGGLGLSPQAKSLRLVIGRIAKTALEVTCDWKDGTSTVLHRVSGPETDGTLKQGIRSAEGSPDRWFVCVAPKGTVYKDARVTGLDQ